MPLNAELFAYSRRDAILVALSASELACTSYGTLMVGVSSWPTSVVCGILCVLLNCTNFQCVAHNFIHNPFFSSRGANRLFSVFNTLALKTPQSLYRIHHFDHHRYNNDSPDPKDGLVRDRSSTYRHAAIKGREESLISYALLGPFRTDLAWLWAGAVRRDRTLVWVELLALLSYIGLLSLLNSRGVLLFLLPVWYGGQVCALIENYCEHHKARPGHRMTDSVSCYSRLYNCLWFNNGYHQEHHYRPQVHWTRVKALRAEMLPAASRRVVRHAHVFNLRSRERATDPRPHAPTR